MEVVRLLAKVRNHLETCVLSERSHEPSLYIQISLEDMIQAEMERLEPT
jgi:hypothetical protein